MLVTAATFHPDCRATTAALDLILQVCALSQASHLLCAIRYCLIASDQRPQTSPTRCDMSPDPDWLSLYG
jgi:hypothetical protein